MQRIFLAVFSSLASAVAWAHPGEHHGGLWHNLAHLLSQPDHLALLALAVLGGFVGARLLRRRAASRSQALRR